MQSARNNNNLVDDNDDVVIESVEIQQSNATGESEVSSQQQSPWPTNMSFASCFQHNSGFSNTNLGFNTRHQNGSPQVKQPRLAANTIDKHPDVAEIIKDIENNYRILICMRGAPGSGKSFLARAIIDRTMNGDHANHIFCTDDFFINPRTKKYAFDRSKLSQSHESNQIRTAQRTAQCWSPIIIDNTNMKLWEMFPYFREAAKNNYIIKILEPNTPWRISVGKLAQRNKHNVDQDSIARMLNGYEPGTVQDVLHIMQIFNYDNPTPQLRCLPEIVEKMKPTQNMTDVRAIEGNYSRFTPREQPRSYDMNYNMNQRERNKMNNVVSEEDALKLAFQKLESLEEEWPAFEEEQNSFWNAESNSKSNIDKNLPKPQRKAPGSTNVTDIYNLLHESKAEEQKTDSKTMNILKKHKKFCENENKSFQEIRQICPTIPIALLWDLFEKCNGDGDWTMDILFNENESKEIQTLNSQEEIDKDNFVCDCDNPLHGLDLNQATNVFQTAPLQQQSLPSRSTRKKQSVLNEDEVSKQIKDLFVISDNRYSDHTRKIRDIRRGATSTTTSKLNNETNQDLCDQDQACAMPSNEENHEENENDEIIEMDLGIELVCQLDEKFGSNTFQQSSLKDIKTTVFMPKSLGQQLYAIWIESLYHQIEEQRQQSIKEDEEFARELQSKQTNQQLFEYPQTKPNISEVADIDYVWKAYNTDANEWKQTTPEDLATKLTKAKLFEMFPNVDRDQLVQVFKANGNKFSETVDLFKENLKTEIDDKILEKSQQVLNQARVEAQAVSKYFFEIIV